MIIANFSYNVKLNQRTYDSIIARLDFSSIYCPHCSSNSWHFHAYYSRSFSIFNRSTKIKITRIICSCCKKTHAILLRDMIPFSSISHQELIEILLSDFPSPIDSSFLLFLSSKFKLLDISSYSAVCSFNDRNLPIIFFPTWLFFLFTFFRLWFFCHLRKWGYSYVIFYSF